MPKRQEIDRIIVGNQIAIMRAIQTLAPSFVRDDLNVRVADIKYWWRAEYGEEVGFSTVHGDKSPDGRDR